MSDRVVAVIPAAGRGRRMGGTAPKQFLRLGGLPLLTHSLRIVDLVDAIEEVVIVVPEADRAYCQTQVLDRHPLHKKTRIVAGGPRRQDSVGNGLAAIHGQPDLVLVHDGVRPFLSPTIVERAIQAASTTGAAVVGIPMKDTVKRVTGEGYVAETLNRDELWIIQTPQVFRFDWLQEAHRWAAAHDIDATDDAALIERLGYPVQVVHGSAHNIKITTPEDLALGEALLTVNVNI